MGVAAALPNGLKCIAHVRSAKFEFRFRQANETSVCLLIAGFNTNSSVAGGQNS